MILILYQKFLTITFAKWKYCKNVVKGVTSEKVDFLSNNYGNFLFYDIMLHYWVKIFGNSDLSVRLLSLLFGLLLIILSYKVSLLLSNNKNYLF